MWLKIMLSLNEKKKILELKLNYNSSLKAPAFRRFGIPILLWLLIGISLVYKLNLFIDLSNYSNYIYFIFINYF